MYLEILSRKTKKVFNKLKDQEFLKDFYLAGGTALALQIGHRVSIDLDFFTKKEFKSKDLIEILKKLGNLDVIGQESGTLHCYLDDVKLSFLVYSYKEIFPLIKINKSFKLADDRDIACMKLSAIAGRGSKKDFIDLFFLLKKYSWLGIFKWFKKKYFDFYYNEMHVLKSLIYFKDADKEPMPKMFKSFNWKEVKVFLEKQVKKIKI